MPRVTRDVLRILTWSLANRQDWLPLWFLRGKLRNFTFFTERNRRDGSSHPPLGITLRVTMRCNLRCRMCHVIHSQDATAQRIEQTQDLPPEIAQRLLDELATLGAYVCFSGGEPLLYDGLPQLIEQAHQRGLVATATTNGTLLSKKAEQLVLSGLKALSISVLGPAAIHDQTVACPGAFKQLLEGLRALQAAKQKYQRLTPLVVINCPITDLNINHLRELNDLTQDWPIEALHLQHMWFKPPEALALQKRLYPDLLDHQAFSTMDSSCDPMIDPELLADELEAIFNTPGAHPLVIYPPLNRQAILQYYQEPLCPSLNGTGPRCLWLFTMIHPNGEVSPCEGFNAGNLHDQSLMEIWNSERLRRFRRTLRQQGSLPLCTRCCLCYRRN